MKVPMLIKARKIHQWGAVTKKDITDESEYWEVYDHESKKTHQITFKRKIPTGSTIPFYTLTCDCTCNSLQPKDNPLCAHKVAFLLKRSYELQMVVDYKKNKKVEVKE